MRKPAAYAVKRRSEVHSFPAPTGGWIANRNLAQPNGMQVSPPGAFTLENLFPTSRGAKIRRGTELYATLGDGSLPTVSIFSYVVGAVEQMFAATDTTIYDITTITTPFNYSLGDDLGNAFVTDTGDTFGADSTIGKEVVTGQTSGNWIAVQFATSGGIFLVLVNGVDPMLIYDGTTWYPITNQNLNSLGYKTGTGAFTVGQIVTGTTSGATAPIVKVIGTTATGTLWLGNVTQLTTQYTLAYNTQTANFTVGQTVTGGTSGATGIITSDADAGVTGTLTIHTVTGTFQAAETITDGAGGSAKAGGAQVYSTGGPFRDNEALTAPLGGAAVENGTVTLLFGAITGVDPRNLSYVWTFKNRLFFVGKNTLSAWFMPVDSLTGAAGEIPLGGVFNRGGSLMFGSNWSLDSGSGGSGLSQQCTFFTTEGEVVVFQGSNPGDPTAWSQVNTYKIGKPLGNKAHIRAGGDIVIATNIGFVPLSQAVQRDYAALSPSAVSYPIEDAWNEAVQLRGSSGWNCEVWPSSQMVIVAPPTANGEPPRWFVANARTGAWAPFTNWDATCVHVFKERCFYGSQNGKIVEANVTGLDQGTPYTATYLPLFDDMGNPASLKIAKMARLVVRSGFAIRDQLSFQRDFMSNLPSAPDAAMVPVSSVWGGATWGESVWGQTGNVNTYQNWRVVAGSGYAIASAAQVTSGAIAPLDTEIARLDLAFEISDEMT